MTDPFFEVEDLTIQYETRNKIVTAVDRVSFKIERGEYFGLIGESGCGKSSLAKGILRALDDNGRIASGSIRLNGENLLMLDKKEFSNKIRWDEIAYIPQGSMDSLDPLKRIRTQGIDLAREKSAMSKEEAEDRLVKLFEVVGLQEERLNDYPHQFSGGMSQRVLIAFSLLLSPSLLVADEPTTALDVVMQDQVLKYVEELRESLNISVILVTHDTSVVYETCDRLAVMHAGQFAERGSVEAVSKNASHPYTLLLQEAFTDIRRPDKELPDIQGHPPQNRGEVNYCTFADRCPWVTDECRASRPSLKPVGFDTSEGHGVACFRSDEVRESYKEGDN